MSNLVTLCCGQSGPARNDAYRGATSEQDASSLVISDRDMTLPNMGSGKRVLSAGTCPVFRMRRVVQFPRRNNGPCITSPGGCIPGMNGKAAGIVPQRKSIPFAVPCIGRIRDCHRGGRSTYHADRVISPGEGIESSGRFLPPESRDGSPFICEIAVHL